MNGFERFIHSLKTTMETPESYGTFHFVSILAVIVFISLAGYLLRNTNSKRFRIFLFVCWLIILLLEIYKQVIFSFDYENEKVIWDYEWYAFPFQLCSLQLYLLPFVVFLPDGKVRDGIMAFLATFSFFGGLVVYVYPNDVFMSYIGINIQTMVHHGLQVVLGFLLMVHNRKKLNFKFFLSGVIVFAVMIVIAMGLNLLIPTFIHETFNMFYISPYFDCTLPLLDSIYKHVPYVVFFLIYFICFSLIALLIFVLHKLIIGFCYKKA